MAIFESLIEVRSIQGVPGIQDNEAWQEFLNNKGYYVSSKTALQVSTVFRCVDLVAKTMASLPLLQMENTALGKIKDVKHSNFKLLNKLPNPETTHYEFWHMYIVNLMLTRGAYAKIKRDKNGFIRELWNIPTGNALRRKNKITGEHYLEVWDEDGPIEKLYPGYYMYTQGFMFSSKEDPEDPVSVARQVLGLTMALNGYAQDFFENGANIGGFIEYPGAVTDKAYKNFKESWNDTYAGVKNQHKIAFLESGFKFNRLESKPEEAQALESRKYQAIEICRIWGVPPHKVFEMDKITYNGAEQANIEYVQECLNPMAVRIEETLYRDMLTEREQMIKYHKFNTNALLRGDTKTRESYYSSMRQNGVFSANTILDLEDMNLIPKEEGGDLILVNGNMIPLSEAKKNLPKGAMQKGGTNNAGNS